VRNEVLTTEKETVADVYLHDLAGPMSTAIYLVDVLKEECRTEGASERRVRQIQDILAQLEKMKGLIKTELSRGKRH
jgi:hypothetical protein